MASKINNFVVFCPGVVPGVFLNMFVFSSTALRELGFKVADNLETIEVS